jgi:transposase-like protein
VNAPAATWPDERRAAQSARMRARNADPAYRARKAAGISRYFAAGRPRPLPIPMHAHPLVRQLFEIVNAERTSLRELGERAGVNRETLSLWRRRHMPVLDTFEAALNALDYELVIQQRGASPCRRTRWNDEREALLRACWNDGVSAAEIARRLGGITPAAVYDKAGNLDLGRRSKAGRKPR